MADGATQLLDCQQLVGSKETTVDDKGRVVISRDHRERLGYKFVITIGAAGCAVVYPKSVWHGILSRLTAIDTLNPDKDDLMRLVCGLVSDECQTDSAGRIVIDKSIRVSAGLDGECWVVGCGDHLEIWPKSKYPDLSKLPMKYGGERGERLQSLMREVFAVTSRPNAFRSTDN